MGEKRKRLSLADIRTDMEAYKEAFDAQREERAHNTVQRLLQKMAQGHYKANPDGVEISLWFCPNWWDDYRYFENFAHKEYGITLKCGLSVMPGRRLFTIRL